MLKRLQPMIIPSKIENPKYLKLIFNYSSPTTNWLKRSIYKIFYSNYNSMIQIDTNSINCVPSYS